MTGAGVTDAHPEDYNVQIVAPPLPFLAAGEKLSLHALRDRRESVYFWSLIAFNVVFFACLCFSFLVWPREATILVLIGLSPLLSDWVLWKFTFPSLYGQSIKLGRFQ